MSSNHRESSVLQQSWLKNDIFFCEQRDDLYIAYEAGYRLYPHTGILFDVTGFYHSYDSLITLEPGPVGQPPIIGNGMEAVTSGATFAMEFESKKFFRFVGNLSLLHKELHPDPDSHDLSNAAGEGNDPDYYWTLHTMIDPRMDIQMDAILRSSGELPSPLVPDYVTMDFRIAWLAMWRLELSFVGQNLFQKSHPEFGLPLPARREIERSFYGKVTLFF
jgi:iron complex outermembrane receptor protein